MRTFINKGTQVLPGLFFLFWVSACSDSPAKLIKKRQSELNQFLDNLNVIAANVSSQTLDSDKISLPANAPTMDLDDVGSYAYEGAANTQLFTVQDFLDPDAQAPGLHLFPSRRVWRTVNAMVKDGKFAGPDPKSLAALNHFSGWRYAVVIKARSLTAPHAESEPVSRKVTDKAVYSTATFTGGLIEGDALIYDLSDASFLGGFPFTARSSEHVETTTYGASSGADGMQQQLDKDFTEQIKKAVFLGLVDRLPEDRVYMNGNLRQRVMTEKRK